MRHLIQYSVGITFSLTMAVLPYLSCVKKGVGMRTCETFWVVILVLASAYIIIGEAAIDNWDYCQYCRGTCNTQ
eukprot:6812965-Heterocapsa_arctica.AAC.1